MFILLRASQMNDFYLFITHLDVVTSENILFSLNTLWGEAMGARINFCRGGGASKKGTHINPCSAEYLTLFFAPQLNI